jgi:hypothetical protein
MPAGRGVRAARILAAIVTALATARPARGDTATVPLGLQVELLSKVADYDRTLPGRAEGVVRVVVVSRHGVAESASSAARVVNALSSLPRISGLPHEDTAIEFTDASSLAALCKARSISILYMMPGLTDVDQEVSRALAGVPVLSVSATADGVPMGIVLGFDLVGAQPKLVVSLSACRNQGVRLSSEVLKIATVIE